MTKSQIKAELRRSACEDADPADQISDDAYMAGRRKFWEATACPYDLSKDNCRTLFLLVAEAL